MTKGATSSRPFSSDRTKTYGFFVAPFVAPFVFFAIFAESAALMLSALWAESDIFIALLSGAAAGAAAGAGAGAAAAAAESCFA
jgi:hypothetical protein